MFGTAAAIIVNLIIYWVGTAADIDWEAGDNDPNVAAVVLSTVVGGVIFTIVAMLILRYTKLARPTLVFLAIASVLTLLSLAGPLGAEADTSTQLLLALMHIVVGVLVIGALARAMAGVEERRGSA